jgi:hypothetical protein
MRRQLIYRLLRWPAINQLLLLALVFVASPQTPRTGQIHGSITDNAAAPVPGARVTVTDPSSGAETNVYTDKFGSYRVDGLTPGEVNVQVYRPGFDTATRRIKIGPGAQVSLDIELATASGISHIPGAGTLGYIVLTALISALVAIFVT